MGKLWVVTCDNYTKVQPNRAEARRAARILNTYLTCANPHTVVEADAWNLLADVNLERLRTAVNTARDCRFNYANVFESQLDGIMIIGTPSREDARILQNIARAARDYVVPVAAVEAAWNQRTN